MKLKNRKLTPLTLSTKINGEQICIDPNKTVPDKKIHVQALEKLVRNKKIHLQSISDLKSASD